MQSDGWWMVVLIPQNGLCLLVRRAASAKGWGAL